MKAAWIKNTEFICSSENYRQCPGEPKPEIAFIGRSNVGKSTLINMLAGRKSLAKTSAKPGKTKLINHFLVNDTMYWVDLPGYGWAQLSKEEREKLEKMVKDYLANRENVHCVLVLIDSRHEPQKIDLEFLRWLGEQAIPFVLVFTKVDKNSRNITASNIATYKRKLLQEWESLPGIFQTSALDKTGREELLNFIRSLAASQSFG